MKTSILKIKICGKQSYYEEVDGEKFYLVDVLVDNFKIQARFSEYQLRPEGEYVVSCFIGSTTLESNKRMFTFLDILTIEELNTLQTVPNDVYIGGIITFDSLALPDQEKCDTVINFAVRYNSGSKNGRRNVVHCRIVGKEARKLQKLEKGKVIELKGQLDVANSGAMVVIVSEVILLEDNPKAKLKTS